MSMYTLRTIGICYLCVYTLNCIVFMLAEVPLCPEVWHFDISVSAMEQDLTIQGGGSQWTFNLKMWKGARGCSQGCTNSEKGALLANTGTTLKLQPLPLTEVLLLCAFPKLCLDVLWKQ